MKKIGIAGAGIIGRLIAWRCFLKGYAVTLFDENATETTNSCSFAAAGLLTPYSELTHAELPILKMGMKALELWPQWIAQLSFPIFFEKQGTILIAHAQDFKELQRLPQTFSRRCNNEINLNIKTLSSHELRQYEPELAMQFNIAFYLPDEGQICPRDIMAALKNFLTGKITWHANTFIQKVDKHIIETAYEKINFDYVIDCRGLGAKNDIKNLRGVRGELIYLRAPDVHLKHCIHLFHPRYPIYIVPRPDNIYVIGATCIESEDMSSISVQSMMELSSAAFSVHRGFAEARIIETRVHCRPAMPDNLPYLSKKIGLIRINGLYRHGYLVGPSMVEEVMKFIKDS